MKDVWVKIPIQLIRNTDISDGECRIYSVIRSFGNGSDGKNCFPSTKTIAQQIGCSDAKVKRCRRLLQQKGLLIWIRGKTGQSNRYSFPLEIGANTNLLRTKNETHIGSTVSHHQDSPTKKQYPEKGLKLFHGKDECFVKENGLIRIQISHSGEWVNYGGGADQDFQYGELRGKEAKDAAISMYEKKW